MGRPCASCSHSKAKEIDRKFRSGDTIENVMRWLREINEPVSVNALSRHRAQHVMGVAVSAKGGPRPVSGNFLQAVVAKAHEAMESGEIAPSVQHGIAAQVELNRQADHMADRDMFAKMAMLLTGTAGAVLEGEYTELDEWEAEHRPLLSPG